MFKGQNSTLHRSAAVLKASRSNFTFYTMSKIEPAWSAKLLRLALLPLHSRAPVQMLNFAPVSQKLLW
jgi:hypothetical protein